MSGQQTSLLQAAIEYVRKGWAVLPLHSVVAGRCSCNRTCTSPAKHPRTTRGVKEATHDEAVVRDWWARWPDANIGIAAGAPSGLFVLDVDDKDAGSGSKNLAALTSKHGDLQTMTVKTGNGRHFLFKLPTFAVKNSVGRVAPGIDVRSDGCYVVAAPSRHANGSLYEVTKDFGLSDAPEWLLRSVTQGSKQIAEENPYAAAPDVAEGQRNDTLFKLASALRGKQGMDLEQILPILLEFNNEKCDPPLGEDEVSRIAESACQFPPEISKRSLKRQEENPLYWFKFNLRDWFANQDVMLMSDYQTGWYIRLTALAWQNGGFLPGDYLKLSKLAKAKSPKVFKEQCELVLAEFEEVNVCGEQMLKNSRLAAQYAETLKQWMEKKQAGEASREKWKATQKQQQEEVSTAVQ